jgi:DNA-binding NtrC family response regulator
MLKIVVIEEDVAMRALIGEWLAGAGHEVRVVATVDACRCADDASVERVVAALANLRSQGAQAIGAIQARFPRAAVIGLSAQIGRSFPQRSETTRALGLVRLLAKPCTREELLEAVRHGPLNEIA